MSGFANRVVWITGGGSGIGRALALELGRQGAVVVVSGRRSERLDEVAREIDELGGKALAIPCDVTDESELRHTVDAIIAELGRLDVCIANAGFSLLGTIAELSAEDWRRQFDTNVIGAVSTVRYALPHLLCAHGRVALVGSVAAFFPSPGAAAYTASKYAIRAIGQTLAMELAGTGVSCTLLHPGFVESEMDQVDTLGHRDPHHVDRRPRALMWSAERAAKEMLRALEARKLEHVFTLHGRVAAFVGQHAPRMLHWLVNRGVDPAPRDYGEQPHFELPEEPEER